MSDLTFDGNQAHLDPGAGMGIMLQYTQPGSFVERCVFRNTMRSAVCIGTRWGKAIGFRLVNNTFIECGQLHSAMEVSAVSMVNAIDVLASGNIFQDSPLAFDCELNPFVNDSLINITVRDNVIRTSRGYPTCWGVQVLGQGQKTNPADGVVWPERYAQNVLVAGNLLYGGFGLGAPFYQEYVDHYGEVGNWVKQF